MSDAFGQVPGLPELLDVLLLDGGGHPLASSSGSGHDWSAFWAEEMGAWALELENEWAEEEEGVGERGESLSLYKGSENHAPPHSP